MFSLSSVTGRLKGFVDWLDRIPGFAAMGVGLAVGMFVPSSLLVPLAVVGVVYVVLKADVGSWFK